MSSFCPLTLTLNEHLRCLGSPKDASCKFLVMAKAKMSFMQFNAQLCVANMASIPGWTLEVVGETVCKEFTMAINIVFYFPFVTSDASPIIYVLFFVFLSNLQPYPSLLSVSVNIALLTS